MSLLVKEVGAGIFSVQILQRVIFSFQEPACGKQTIGSNITDDTTLSALSASFARINMQVIIQFERGTAVEMFHIISSEG